MPVLAQVSQLPNGYLSVSCSYDKVVLEQFKLIPGCAFNWDTRTHDGPPEAICEVLEILTKARLAVVVGAFKGERSVAHTYSARLDGLYEYQKRGVSFMLDAVATTGAALLADGMGLGKTVQALRALEALLPPGGRALVICPAMAIPVWLQESPKWIGVTPIRLDGPKTKKQEAARRAWETDGGLAVISYESFASRSLAFADVVVLDEIHYTSNPKARRTVAIKDWLSAHENRPKMIGTSGTPMTVRTRNLWQPLDMLWPGRFGSKSRFEKRYSAGRMVMIQGLEDAVWKANGATNIDELSRRLIGGGLMLRRVAEDELDLPQMRRIVHPVELPEKAVDRLRKAVALANFDDSTSVNRLLSNVEEYKVAAAVDLAKRLRDDGHRSLIYTLRKETAREIAEALGAPYVTGEDPVSKRVEKLTSGDIGVATLYSVTVGLNGLTVFDTGLFVGMDYVPSTLLQAEARLFRIGQQRRTQFYYLIALRTIDEVVREKVIERLDTFSEIVGTATGERALADMLGAREDEQAVIDDILAAVLKGAI